MADEAFSERAAASAPDWPRRKRFCARAHVRRGAAARQQRWEAEGCVSRQGGRGCTAGEIGLQAGGGRERSFHSQTP